MNIAHVLHVQCTLYIVHVFLQYSCSHIMFADYVGSFVDELADLHNFTLKSQWLHLLEFNFQTKEVELLNVYDFNAKLCIDFIDDTVK